MVRRVHDLVVDDGLGHTFYFFPFYFAPALCAPFHLIVLFSSAVFCVERCIVNNFLCNLRTLKERERERE